MEQNKKSLPHTSYKLLPLQRPENKFCSLADLKNCLDYAQINSLQKESKDSILKLLEGEKVSADAVDERRCLYTLWKNSMKEKNKSKEKVYYIIICAQTCILNQSTYRNQVRLTRNI